MSDERAYAQVLDGLMARWPENQMEPSLDRIRSLVDLLGDPQQAYPVIHVTGTNGKTTTARMVESVLRAFGLRTGLYTSPHLSDVRERILLDGEPIDRERFLEVVADVQPFVDMVDERSAADGGPPMSFFEVMTAIAFAAFADAPVDVAIIEVGLGGEWDATNVADGTVAIVTPVDLDHTELLGDTAVEIATEKSGIIKPGSVAVIAAQEQDVMEVLMARCADVGASVVRSGIDFGVVTRQLAVGGQVLALQGLGGLYDDIVLPLFGPHQGDNAAVALAAVESFLGGGRAELDADNVRQGFGQVRSPGRLEIVRRSPTVIVDAAHNPHGARALTAALDDSFDFIRLIGVLAVLEGKDVRGILRALEPALTSVVVTRNSSPRCLEPEQLAAVAETVFGDERVVVAQDLTDAIDIAVGLAEEDGVMTGIGVLVTGSVVTAGEARRLMLGDGA